MQVLDQALNLAFDADLIQKYNCSLPRYTSYPPATELSTQFPEQDWIQSIQRGNDRKTPLSLYCHIPFCESACYFCGCNTVITQHKAVTETYLDYLQRHVEQVSRYLSDDRLVNQMHWGGGTPNYLSIEQVQHLWKILHQHFQFTDDAELSIEVNPRPLTESYVSALRSLGFNRISFGIQDFNPVVQEAINRIQPEEMLFQAMDWMRAAEFESINVDLIYGLPFQDLNTFRETLHKTLALNPDRIAVFNFAYVPWMKPIQRRIPYDALPSAEEKLDILQMTIATLTEAGYTFIGMDHFAKPDDELAIAQRQGQLHRNFQGYTTQPDSDLIGFGMTSIGMLNDVYTQNQKRLRDYYRAIDYQTLPIERGVTLDADDILRRSIIMELMCQFQVDRDVLAQKYGLSFKHSLEAHFPQEYLDLRNLEADGLLTLMPNRITITPIGRLLVRNIASVFDRYLRAQTYNGFSKAV